MGVAPTVNKSNVGSLRKDVMKRNARSGGIKSSPEMDSNRGSFLVMASALIFRLGQTVIREAHEGDEG